MMSDTVVSDVQVDEDIRYILPELCKKEESYIISGLK
jgi:hypothetical protein